MSPSACAGAFRGIRDLQEDVLLRSHSSVAAWHEPSHTHDYFSFTDVKLSQGSLLFFKSSGASHESQKPPAEILLNQHEAVIPMPVHEVELCKENSEMQCNRAVPSYSLHLFSTR